jgi:hypothetical protein
MEAQDHPIQHFKAMVDLAAAAKAIPAQVLDSHYSYESFGSWAITLQCKGTTVRVVCDGKEREVSLRRSRAGKAPDEWDEASWRRPLPSGQLDAELQAEIVRTLNSL